MLGTPVPEATIDEYRYFGSDEGKVRLAPDARNWAIVYSIAKTHLMQNCPDFLLWVRIALGLVLHPLARFFR